ncbi:MAG: HAD-IA family hydrolase [Sphingomonadales bacterium]
MSARALVLFDCDGTLVDSQHMIIAAMDEAFLAHGLTPPDAAAVRRIVGLSLAPAVALLLPPDRAGMELVHDVVEAYKRAFRRMRMDGGEEPLYPGIEAVIPALAGAGYVLGVATGKSTRGLKAVLKRHGLTGYFETLQTADGHPGKPHPSMVHEAMAETGAVAETTIVIGDTTFDMEMARAARTRALGVSWGYHPPPELLLAGALSVLDQAPDITGTVSGLLTVERP